MSDLTYTGRVVDDKRNWRIMYHIAADAIVILDVFIKETATTPKAVLDGCRRRLAAFNRVTRPKRNSHRAKE